MTKQQTFNDLCKTKYWLVIFHINSIASKYMYFAEVRGISYPALIRNSGNRMLFLKQNMIEKNWVCKCNPPRSNMEYMYMYIIIMNISIALTTLYKTNMVEFQSLALS